MIISPNLFKFWFTTSYFIFSCRYTLKVTSVSYIWFPTKHVAISNAQFKRIINEVSFYKKIKNSQMLNVPYWLILSTIKLDFEWYSLLTTFIVLIRLDWETVLTK